MQRRYFKFGPCLPAGSHVEFEVVTSKDSPCMQRKAAAKAKGQQGQERSLISLRNHSGDEANATEADTGRREDRTKGRSSF
jgi:hypothetical protein